MASMIDLDYDWEAERRARIAHRRRMWFAKYFAVLAYAVLAVGFFISVAVLAYVGLNQKRNERAAYNEGRYGVSREVALAMADACIGLCAEEIVAHYRTASAPAGGVATDRRDSAASEVAGGTGGEVR